ncbi:hypothetical protein [Muricoccus radiodurans]|uniref:hypothetical protein n=1 Tax=Muricoccus radiodurans TaxID=2231721 RepID=UPI003CEC8E68
MIAVARRPHPFTADLRLSGTILRMISLNSLAAFTQDVSKASGIGALRPIRATPSGGSNAASAAPQRLLGAVPPAPAAPLPRGSLLDLRV